MKSHLIRSAIVAVATLSTTLVASPAFAAGPRAGFNAALAFAGKLDVKTTGFADTDDDLEVTAGFSFFGYWPVLRNLHLGAEMAFQWWKGELQDNANFDANMAMDISVLIKGRIPFASERAEVYLVVPFGYSLNVPSDDVQKKSQFQSIETGHGFNYGIRAGAGYRVWRGLWLNLEMGWGGRKSNHSFKNFPTTETDFTMNQMVFRFGSAWEF